MQFNCSQRPPFPFSLSHFLNPFYNPWFVLACLKIPEAFGMASGSYCLHSNFLYTISGNPEIGKILESVEDYNFETKVVVLSPAFFSFFLYFVSRVFYLQSRLNIFLIWLQIQFYLPMIIKSCHWQCLDWFCGKEGKMHLLVIGNIFICYYQI